MLCCVSLCAVIAESDGGHVSGALLCCVQFAVFNVLCSVCCVPLCAVIAESDGGHVSGALLCCVQCVVFSVLCSVVCSHR